MQGLSTAAAENLQLNEGPSFLSTRYGKKGKIEAQHLAFELTELFASGELTPQDMDGIMYEMHKAYFKYREQKREKERIMNL